MNNQFYGRQGMPLLGEPGPRPVLTVEAAPKWYALYLINPDGWVEPITFDLLDHVAEASRFAHGPAYRDHAPNPHYVEQLAERAGWELEEMALEMIIGRWELESRSSRRG